MKPGHKIVIIMAMVVIAALVTSMLSSALFGLQHKWYNTSQSGNQVPCSKCHSNVKEEFDGMPSGAPHKSKACEYCHRNQTGYTYASGGNPVPTPGKEAHAASIPPCRQCHEYKTTNLSSVNESHKPLNDTSGLNEACISCHTGFDKSLNFTRALYVEYDLVDTSGYKIQNFSFVSSNSTIINLTPAGSKHTWENASKMCFDCHSDVKSALASGGHVPSSGNTSGSEKDKQGKMRKAEEGHKGRRHNFSRTTPVTIESCKPCHLPNASDFGSWEGSMWHKYTHPEAQLDYHAATTEHCYNCHFNGTINAPCGGGMDGGGGNGGGGSSCRECHDILRAEHHHGTSNYHADILDSMFNQSFCWYQIDKVCIGCHMPGPDDNVPFYDRHFEVYTVPNTAILVTPTPPP